MSESQAPKIQIDSDWKAEAQREKERLAQQSKAEAQAKPSGGPGGGERRAAQGQMPPANFDTLVSTMATQGLLFMGAIPDPRTGQRIPPMLDLARHHIDMLAVIEEKTKGNLSEEEDQMLAATLYELRQRYIQLSAAARQK